VSKQVQPGNATPSGAIFSALMALLYGASPIDLIPDLIPVLGWLDDAAIVPLLLIVAFFQYKKVQKRNTQQRKGYFVMPER
jgi:uncharacterized membrane protein YkvA (DUF1232 family)